MGNEQSCPSPDPKSPMKLTKPKTNNSTSNLLTVRNGTQESLPPPTPPKDNYPETDDFESAVVVTTVTGDRRSRQDARQKLHSQLYGADAEAPLPESGDDLAIWADSSDLAHTVSPLPSTYQSPDSSPSASSTPLSLIRVAPPERYSASPEPMERLHERIEAQARLAEHAAKKVVEHRTSMPIRRKSLLIPGIATRGRPGNILRKPPPIAKDDTYVNSEESIEHMLHDLLDPPKLSYADTPYTRGSTPPGIEKPSLGDFEPGTLRITNGSASPAPSNRTAVPLSSESPERGRAGSWDTMFDTKRFPGLAYAPAPVTPSRQDRSLPPLPNVSAVRLSEPVALRPDSDTASFQESILAASEDEATEISAEGDVAYNIARQYMEDLPDSPFPVQDSRASSPRAESVSESAFAQTRPIYDEDESAETHSIARGRSPESKEYTTHQEIARQESLRILTGAAGSMPAEKSLVVSGSVRSQLSSVSTQSDDTTVEGSPNWTPIASDSGYSSHSSFESEREVTRTDDKQMHMSNIPPPSHPPPPVPAHASNIPPPSQPPPPVPAHAAKDDIELGRAAPLSVLYKDIRQQFRMSLPAQGLKPDLRPTLLTTLTQPRPLPAPPTAPLATELIPTPATPIQRSPQYRKLRKQRPMSQPPPPKPLTLRMDASECPRDVPPVPAEVSARLAERLKWCPALDRTYPSRFHTSPLSANRFSDVIPAESLEPSSSSPHTTPVRLRYRDTPQGSPLPFGSSVFRGRGSGRVERLMTQQAGKQGVEPDWSDDNVLDFGTVAESLGAGPYDAARPAGRLPTAMNGSLQSPYQLGRPQHNRRPSMTEEEAAEYARQRSRDHPNGGRRRSISNPWNADELAMVGGRPLARPVSMVAEDAPPIPQLPALSRARQSSRDELWGAESPSDQSMQNTYLASKDDQQQALWDTHRQAWRERYNFASSKSTYNPATPPARRPAVPPHRSSAPAPKRFSTPPKTPFSGSRYEGGLDFGYEAGVGMGGSAGTRAQGSAASRKSEMAAREYGLDLTDVPVFVQAR